VSYLGPSVVAVGMSVQPSCFPESQGREIMTWCNQERDIDRFLTGEEIYGDTFTEDEVRAWYEDEQRGYYELSSGSPNEIGYKYYALNEFHGFRRMPRLDFGRLLAFGAAAGDEIRPLIKHVRSVDVVEPAEEFWRDEIDGIPCSYVKPVPSGQLPYDDNQFDLVTCFGVLHHIPNVSFVLGEIYRTMRPGAYLLLREPISSMGDWREPRRGLTARERGLPLKAFEDVCERVGFEVRRCAYCMFPLIGRFFPRCGIQPYNSPLVSRLDWILCALFRWNYRYHRRTWFEKLAPQAAFWILVKE
jgi:SAM-dependent methyltransferase